MRKYLDSSEQKALLMEMFDYVDSFCRNEGIKYFLLGGTLIGAVRHKGFIPWDDDIDICMLREDYQKFINSFYDRNGRYRLICPENDKLYYLPMAKVIDNSTELSEAVPGGENLGLYLDVFPIDNCPGDYDDACSFGESLKLYRSIITVKNLSISKDRKMVKNIELLILKIVCLPINRRKMINKVISIATKYQGKQTEYVGELLLMPYGKREIYKKEWFSDLIELEFEGKMFYAPIGYHDILSTCFGNYMELPPEEKRVSHHDIKVWRK